MKKVINTVFISPHSTKYYSHRNYIFPGLGLAIDQKEFWYVTSRLCLEVKADNLFRINYNTLGIREDFSLKRFILK